MTDDEEVVYDWKAFDGGGMTDEQAERIIGELRGATFCLAAIAGALSAIAITIIAYGPWG